jgi:hypothetical protein
VNDERRSDGGPWAHIGAHTDPGENIDEAGARSELISVGNGDENVAKIQLAARWAEHFAPESDDTLEDALRRFKRVYMYVDSVSKLVEPDEV